MTCQEVNCAAGKLEGVVYGIKDPIAEWPRIKRELRTRPLLLLINYEGVLVPTPSVSSSLDYDLRELLLSLRSKPAVTVGIISGLGLSSLQNLVRINGLYYASRYGLEIRGPEMEFVHPVCTQGSSELQTMKGSLEERLRGVSGIAIEEQGFSLSLSYQQVVDNSQKEAARDIAGAVIQPYVNAGKFRIVEWKDSMEIIPMVNWDKGRVVKMFENLISSRKTLPLTIYLGADYSDEEAFRNIKGKGIGIVVGRRNTTAAGYYLSGHSEVLDFFLLLESFY
ncbi:MAG: trehalose-phosphatase [bacterium]|nr:trehalose-phosphatase [bacterium]